MIKLEANIAVYTKIASDFSERLGFSTFLELNCGIACCDQESSSLNSLYTTKIDNSLK
jgi:hypothetical protein